MFFGNGCDFEIHNLTLTCPICFRDNRIIPSLIFYVQGDDGEEKAFNVSLQKFHQLRFQTALMLQKLHKLDDQVNKQLK